MRVVWINPLFLITTDSIEKVAINENRVKDANGDPNPFSEVLVQYCPNLITSTSFVVPSGIGVDVYQNPAQDHFRLVSRGIEVEILVRVISVLGQVVFEQKMSVDDLRHKNFETSTWPTGIYIVQCKSLNMMTSCKFMIY